MLEGFPACRIAFDSMAEVACEAAKVAYKEKLGDLQSASVEEKPGIVSALEALGLQLETMGWLPSKHPLTEELSFVRSIPAAAKTLSPSSAEKTVFSEAVDGVMTQAGMVNLVCDHNDLVGG